MPDNKATMGDKIARLKESFASQLPVRFAQINQLNNQLHSAGALDAESMADLHRHWHSLKGASRVFGFHELAKVATQAERLVQNLQQQLPDGTAIDTQLLDSHSELLQQLQQASQQGSENPPESFNTPYFEMSQVQHDWGHDGLPMIYLCDDEKEQLQFLEYQLKCFGYQVRSFTTVSEFEQAALSGQPDAVIMDVHFPGGSTAGTEALRRVNEQLGCQLPAMALSGMEHFNARLSAWRAGCRSYFIKPAKPTELARALDKLINTGKHEPYKILIVDDEQEIAEYHSLILKNAGMVVQHVQDPTVVLETLRDFTPDLILIDVYMPGCTGYELAGVIRQVPEYLGMSIIYLSSETDRQKQFNAMQVGVEAFITKPVQPEDLVSAVVLRAERMRALRGIMTRDGLTGLYNHTTATEVISMAMAQASRNQEPMVLAALDLDKFKRVNDTYGHLAGDQVLLALSHVLKNRLRQGDIIGRYGGEEFVILLRNINMQDAYALMDRLREEFSQILFSSGKEKFHCTFSVGLASYTSFALLEQLMGAADQALYQAKNRGRNQVVIHEDSL